MKTLQIFRKSMVVLLCVAIAGSLVACSITLPEFIPEPTMEEVTQSQPEETEAPKMTAAEFVEKAEGIWIFDETVGWMYEDQYRFDVLEISGETCVTAVYPGGYDRPGTIWDVEVLDENTVKLSLVYEAGEFMGDMLPEAQDTLTITFMEAGKIKAHYGERPDSTLTFGGADFDEAHAVARSLAEP